MEILEDADRPDSTVPHVFLSGIAEEITGKTGYLNFGTVDKKFACSHRRHFTMSGVRNICEF